MADLRQRLLAAAELDAEGYPATEKDMLLHLAAQALDPDQTAALQEPVVVKPLEWVPTIISERHLRDVANGLGGLIAYEVGVEENYVLVNGRGLGIKKLGKFPSLAYAKAAAQSDYDARVRAMLVDPSNVQKMHSATDPKGD